MYDMDIDEPEMNTPGGPDFRDVTGLFSSASRDMESGSMVMVDGFSLQDAMSAIEIGEPRLDTGLSLQTEKRQLFDPLTPLLPQELCWIIDRSLSYEMEWHASSPLSHTVFTLLYVHSIRDIDPDMHPMLPMFDIDPSRPLGLITVVLRAYVCGMLKCCDLSWRELSKGSLHDTEDWQGDKCDVSLLEGWPVKAALARLEGALNWLFNTPKVSIIWRDALRTRISFRKIILELMEFNVHHDYKRFITLIHQARSLLANIRSNAPPDPAPDSPARLAFDPYVARTLNTFLPVRVVEVRTPQETWDTLELFLDGWEELWKLSQTHSISTWEVVGYHQTWLSTPPARPAYIRSSIQTAFYDGILVLNQHHLAWVVDRFFTETLGTPYSVLVQYWGVPGCASLLDMEKAIVHTVVPHLKALWYNPPRRRRFLIKSLLDWHIVYDRLCIMVDGLDISGMSTDEFYMISLMPTAALMWRLASMREVILSGFQLELFSAAERPFAYWYVAHVIEVHLACLDRVMKVMPHGSPACAEIAFQQLFLTALQSMAIATFVVLNNSRPETEIFEQWEQLRPNIVRRYKWAFKPEYDDYELAPVASPPNFAAYLNAVRETHEESKFSPPETFAFAGSVLNVLISGGNTGSCARAWCGDRLRLIRGLAEVCQNLCDAQLSPPSLTWDPLRNPWFPLAISGVGT